MPEINLPTKVGQDAIKTAVDNINTNVSSVKTDVSTVNTNVSNVKSTVDAVKTNVANVQSSVNNLSSANLLNGTWKPNSIPITSTTQEATSSTFFSFSGKAILKGVKITLTWNSGVFDTLYIDGNIYKPSSSSNTTFEIAELPVKNLLRIMAYDRYNAQTAFTYTDMILF